MAEQKAPNCYQCKHYYVTWEKSFPHGCRSLNFKCKTIPSREVFLASGIHCYYFEDKNPVQGEQVNRPNSTFNHEA